MQISVKEIRSSKNYNTSKVADILGISTGTYALYEKNPELIPPDIAIKIARMAKISVDDIFFG